MGKVVKRSLQFRSFKNLFMMLLLFLCVFVSLVPLISVLYMLFQKGMTRMDWEFFTTLPKPVGEVGGGLGHSVLGTLVLLAGSSVIGVPIGIFTGVYLSEFSKHKYVEAVRSSVEVLASIPSIVVGLFVYALLVVPMKGFSVLAGSVALSILLIPTLAKMTEEVLKLVPNSVREAGLALGLPRYRVILWVVVYGSRAGIVSGVVLALARVAGETAPLLFTALNANYWFKGVASPTSSLPIQIFTYAVSPFEEWNQLAWTGALVLVLMIVLANLTMRYVFRNKV